jgi:transposase InsO family protein
MRARVAILFSDGGDSPSPAWSFIPIEAAQYTSAQYARLVRDNEVRLSVGRTGQCWDNAVAESFFATIKTELLDRQPWPTKAMAHKAIFEYIEGWYNTRRRHSSLGYLSQPPTKRPATPLPDLR